MAKLLAIAMFLALVLNASAQQSDPGSKTWAVVIGVSKYQKLPGGQQLQFAERDAVLFAEAIQKRGVAAQNVRLLTGAEATAAAMKSAIGNWLARSASESDTVLVFFSGHGLFEREFGESYLLGCDSDPKDPYGTALSVSELGQALGRRVRSGRVLVIADALRRDFFDPDSDPGAAKSFGLAFEQLTATRPGVSAIIASGPGEFSREGQRWSGHGVFTKHLADVLIDGGNPSGNVANTADELFDLLKARVADDTANKQHPWRSGTSLARIPARTELPARTAPPDVAAQPAPAQAVKPAEVGGGKPITQADVKTDREPKAESKPTETSRVEDKTGDARRPVANPNTQPTGTLASEKKPEPMSSASEKKANPAPTSSSEKKAEPAAVVSERKEVAPTNVIAKTPSADAASKPAATSSAAPKPITAAPTKASPPRAVPPAAQRVREAQSISPPPPELARAEVAVGDMAAPPKPTITLPSSIAVSSERAAVQPETLSAAVPTSRPEAAPSPLVLQLEAAIASKNLIEPKNANAWEFYTRLSSESDAAADVARLKPVLAEALLAAGRAIVTGDVRSDNISDKVDDFKRAGQMLARARTVAPANAEVIALEKLSATEALIALQFYDEAERALAQFQGAKLASVENALGLVYQGKLDTWRAERALKRAIELDSKWAAPHYNLALLYRGQQNQASLAEFEAATALDAGNVNLLAALAEEYFTRQQWKQAAEAFRKAIALKPADDTLHTKLGHALYSQGLQEEANREYQKARDLRGKQP